MKKNTCFRLLALILMFGIQFNFVLAQNLTEVKDSIYSDILKEQRSIRVFLPETYKPGSGEKYETIYLTDGEWAAGVFP
jgi:hypothetical protein